MLLEKIYIYNVKITLNINKQQRNSTSIQRRLIYKKYNM